MPRCLPPSAIFRDGGAVLVRLVVYGSPAPQGSKRHVGGGRMIESSKRLKPWRDDVKHAAEALIQPHRGEWAPLDGPLRVRMIFTLRKPASAPKRTVTYPDRTPDLSKLVRAVEDALTDAGIWVDDARVISCHAVKAYPNEHDDALDTPGVVIEIMATGKIHESK